MNLLSKPWLLLSSKLAHDLSPYGLEIYSLFRGYTSPPEWNPFQFKNLHFPNRLGIAGGVDKNADHVLAWQRMGCGFIEIGTVTPESQKPNAGRIMERDIPSKSVWNKMGFPSAGADEVYFNLKQYKPSCSVPIFVNIGKNRTTSNDEAHHDYNYLISKFSDLADAYVINISSPNTQGLRDLAQPKNFLDFIKPIKEHHRKLNIAQPLFLKISPDLDNASLESVIECSLDEGLDGFILTNTTLDREATPFYPKEGGVSGKPLKEKSIQALCTVKKLLDKKNEKKCLISTGGVMTEEDVFERIALGADLVQVYSTLVYEGPGFFRKVSDFVKHTEQQQTNSTRRS